MSISKRLEGFLNTNKVTYEVVTHPQTLTSQKTAQAEHISGKEVAKVVMIKADGKDVMTVVPASRMLDLSKLKKALGTNDVKIDDEKEFAHLFSDCELGAMPALGALYKIPCYVDKTVLEPGEVYFNGGNHKQSVKLSAEDYQRIANAEIGDIAK